MTKKEIVLETIRALPDDCSLEEISKRIEFMAAVQKGLDQELCNMYTKTLSFLSNGHIMC